MKKSLACTVLAGLLAGCVMTGAEAGDPIDIVINQDGTVTPNTYGGENYIGVHEKNGIVDIGSNVKTIRTDGELNTSRPVIGVYAQNPGTFILGQDFSVIGNSISEININTTNGGSYGIATNGGRVQLYNVGKIVTKGAVAYGIFVATGVNEIGFTGESIVEAHVTSSGDQNVYGIYSEGGTTTITDLKKITVSNNSRPFYAYAIYAYDGKLNISGIDNSNLLSVNGNVYALDGEITLGNAFVTGYVAEGSRSGNILFDKKVVVAGNMDFLNVIAADDSGDDFTFGKADMTSVIDLAGVDISDVGARVKIYGYSQSIYPQKISYATNVGSLTFEEGYSLIGNIFGTGTLTIESGLLQFNGNQKIENKVVIKNGASFDPKADYLSSDTTVEAGGKLYVSTGTLSTDIKGVGTTYLKANPTSTAKETVTVNTNQSIEGTLNGSDGTIKLSGGTAYTLTVGKLAGITNLDVAVDFSGGSALNGMMSIGAAESGAVLNVSNVNVTADIPDGTNNGVVTYATGAGVADVTHKVNGQVGGSITASANKIYTFTQDMLNPGKLNWSVQTTSNPITFKEFIEGTYEGKPSTLSLTENMVDGPNGGTADSGLASQTNDSLYINLNGHTLGTEGNKFTVKVASGKEVYLNGGTGDTSHVYTSWTLGELGTGYASLNTSGNLWILGDIEGVGMLTNDGTVMMGGNVDGSLLLTNNGSLALEGRQISIGQITNSGELIINSDYIPGNYYLNGDVYHNTGAKTKINLVGKDDGMAALYGRVYGSDENFEMTLRQAEWQMDNVVDRSTVDFGTIHNVSLEKGGSISTNLNTMYYVDNLGSYTSAVAWRDVYGTATFHNLKNDGTGRIDLAVDLKNNVGDQIILQGETPEKLNVMLVDKNSDRNMEFVPDGEHSVTYAKAPLSSDLEIDTSLVPMYGKQSMIYTPIVETEEGDGERFWNFVGWSQRPRESKENVRNAQELPHVLPNVEVKRLEEIHRYAVHKDLSELGAWVRGETGRMSVEGMDFNVKVISGGYDWANKTSKGNFFMGLGVSHGTSNADMSYVGDSKNTSFSLYGSWYGRKNYDYIDFVAKYGKIDHEYNGTNFDGVPCEGEYDKKMYSFFLKYGRRVPLKNGFYLEPFGSFTYGHINDADFYDKGQDAHMHVDAINSKIASLGVMFGKSVKGTEFYCKFAYSYDFDGEIRGSVAEHDYSEKTDMGGSSYKFAIGASRNLGKQNSLHLDLEKDFGGKMKRPWNLSLTFKHTW